MRLTQKDVDYIADDLWEKRHTIINKIHPHLLHHFPLMTTKEVEGNIKRFLSYFKNEGVGSEGYYVECGRMKLSVEIEEPYYMWRYYIGFVESVDNWLFDEELAALHDKEW